MRPSHGDYKPSERRRYVPSGPPRRKIPVLRVALLLGLGVFAFMQFDSYWPRVRQVLHLRSGENGSGEVVATTRAGSATTAAPVPTGSAARSTATAPTAPKWSPDSSLLAMDCPRGLSGACCEALDAASRGLCGEASSLLARAGWKGLIGRNGVSEGYVRVEARALPDEPTRRMALSGMAGRDERGGFVLRRREDAGAWCDAARGCLGGRPAPATPLSDARLQSSEDGAGAATWISTSPWVRAALPGRVLAVDSTEGGVIVRLYHGFELYTVYGPLRAVPGVRPGAIVKTGSHLGDAPARDGLYALSVRVRQGGRALNASVFWGERALAAAPDPVDDTKGTP